MLLAMIISMIDLKKKPQDTPRHHRIAIYAATFNLMKECKRINIRAIENEFRSLTPSGSIRIARSNSRDRVKFKAYVEAKEKEVMGA